MVGDIKRLLVATHQEIIDGALKLASEAAVASSVDVCGKFEAIEKELQHVPADIEELAELSGYVDGVKNLIDLLAEDVARIDEYNAALDKFSSKVIK